MKLERTHNVDRMFHSYVHKAQKNKAINGF